MENTMLQFIDDAIELELNMSKLYSLFSEYIDEDRAFWYRIAIEEKNHAALLRTGKDFVRLNKFPSGLLPENPEMLKRSVQKVRDAIDTFISNPNRILAFNLALEIENSAGEIHFQHFMEKDATDNLRDIFQKLNQADKDHAQRIHNYWQSTGNNKE